MCVFKSKVVGLNFHKVENPVESGDYVILAAEDNEHDSDAIGVYNAERELIGHIANSDKTLSINNRKNGNISATELKGELSFDGIEYYAEVVRVYSSCIYLEINEGKWSYINKPVPELTFKKAIDLQELDVVEVPAHKIDVIESVGKDVSLMSEIIELKSMVADLLAEVKTLKTAIDEGDNSPSKSSSERTFYSFVGLSHFDGQDHIGGELTIVEEPIFEGAKGTAVYLKSEDYRIGVSPSAKKKQYCEDHNIPYCENKSLKGKVFGGDIKIEEMVPDEYIVVSV